MEKKGEAERTKKNGDILMKTLTNKQTTIWWNAKLEPIKKTKRQEGGKKGRRKKKHFAFCPYLYWNSMEFCLSLQKAKGVQWGGKYKHKGHSVSPQNKAVRSEEVFGSATSSHNGCGAFWLQHSRTCCSRLPICCMSAVSTRCNNCVRQSPANRSRSVRHRAAARGP